MAEDRKSYFVAAGEPWTIGMIGGPSLEITPGLRQAIIDGPEVLDDDRGRRAYVFGRAAPSKKAVARGKWISAGYHGNDNAGTGLVDVTDGDHSGKDFDWSDQLDEVMEAAGWEAREAAAACRAMDARVLWMDETPGGDFGAELFIPAEDEGKPATGLIVNVFYYKGVGHQGDDPDDSESSDDDSESSDDSDEEVARFGGHVAGTGIAVASASPPSTPPLTPAENDNDSQLSSGMSDDERA